jgi:hypothetical protein
MSLGRAVVWGVLVSLLGCDGVGRAIVYKRDTGAQRPGECRRPRPACEPPGPISVQSEDAPRDMKLAPCGDAVNTSALGYCELRVQPEAGPLTLSGMTLVHVRIVLAAGQHLTLAESDLTNVAILGDDLDEAGRAGEVFITHSIVRGSDLALDQVQLLSSEIDGSSIQANQLVGDDLALIGSDLTVHEARLAAITMRRSGLRGCAGGVLIAGGRLLRVQLACEGKLQLYATTVDLSTVDGDIEGHTAAFADGSFGVEHPTGLTNWVGSLDNMVFCGEADRLRVSGGTVECVDCEGPIAEPEPDACTDPEGPVDLKLNICAALKEPATCESFAPPRRPIDQD